MSSKITLATNASLLLVAIAVMAAVSVTSAPTQTSAPEETLEARSLDQTQDSDSEVPRIRSARYLKTDEENDTQEVDNDKENMRSINTNPSCFSDMSNETVPAAHIKGQGLKFRKSHGNNVPLGYQQRWKCTESGLHRASVHAFVDGGMCFNQTDKTLGVPICGYYMVTSQVLFNIQSSSLEESTTVYHLMKFKRNCPGTGYQSIVVTGKATVGPFTMDNHHAGLATTYTSDIIKLCAGGSIWIEIPDGDNGVPCCPTGDPHGTFITAVLVSESPCHWPPHTIMKYLDH